MIMPHGKFSCARGSPCGGDGQAPGHWRKGRDISFAATGMSPLETRCMRRGFHGPRIPRGRRTAEAAYECMAGCWQQGTGAFIGLSAIGSDDIATFTKSKCRAGTGLPSSFGLWLARLFFIPAPIRPAMARHRQAIPVAHQCALNGKVGCTGTRIAPKYSWQGTSKPTMPAGIIPGHSTAGSS